jgi:2-polyprenyl-3-methyl-5-hydroxy-6-metoxy-1,4-benzoquinol methylase
MMMDSTTLMKQKLFLNVMTGYYESERRDLLVLVPEGAQRVLDVGCGEGNTGRALKAARPEVFVAGIEKEARVAEIAAAHLDDVQCVDLDTIPFGFAQQFDCIICGDVLEHLKDPAVVLRQLHEALAEDGVLLWSVPNVRHYTIVAGLLLGEWEYQDSGILDRTHLRFFTLKSARQLLATTGFEIVKIERRLGDVGNNAQGRLSTWHALQTNERLVKAAQALLPEAHLPDNLDMSMPDLLTLQYVFVARRT